MTSVLHEFTTKIPHWEPRVAPVKIEEATPAQLEALKVTPSNNKISDYLMVLAHDVETLRHRSPLYNAIMFDAGGLSRAERELGAVGASMVNRCIYCAAVHSGRYNQLAKDEQVIARVFADGVDADISPRLSAILKFAVRISACPTEIDETDVSSLADAGLNKEEILDLILSSSLFGWANRLMHTLGSATDGD